MLRLTTKATAFSFQSVMTSADARLGQADQGHGGQACCDVGIHWCSPPDCGHCGRVRQILAAKVWEVLGGVPGNFREIRGRASAWPRIAIHLSARFRFDARTGRAVAQWRRGQAHAADRRRCCAMLAERAQELVTKQELFDRVWGGLAVSDDALTILHPGSAAARSATTPGGRATIETRHRRGYRLMVPATAITDRSSDAAPPRVPAPEPARLVGRVAELEELARRFHAGAVGPASGRVRDRRARHRQELARRNLSGAAADRPRDQDRARPMPRSSRRRRALPSLDRGVDCVWLAAPDGNGSEGDSCSAGAELAGADAVAVDSLGSQRARSARPRDARAHDARIDRLRSKRSRRTCRCCSSSKIFTGATRRRSTGLPTWRAARSLPGSCVLATFRPADAAAVKVGLDDASSPSLRCMDGAGRFRSVRSVSRRSKPI